MTWKRQPYLGHPLPERVRPKRERQLQEGMVVAAMVALGCLSAAAFGLGWLVWAVWR